MLELVPSTGNFKDSIRVNADGTFSYTTTKITAAFRANLTNRKQIQIQLFIAPGYNLEIEADVKDNQTAKSTLNYKGLGSKINSYWKELMIDFKPDTVKWHLEDEDPYIAFLKRPGRLSQIMERSFGADNLEPYRDYFKQSLLLEVQNPKLVIQKLHYLNRTKLGMWKLGMLYVAKQIIPILFSIWQMEIEF